MSKVRKVQSTNYTTTDIPKTGAEWVSRTRPRPRRANFFTRTTPRLLRHTEDQNQYCWSEDHDQDTSFHFPPKTKSRTLGRKTKTQTEIFTSRPRPRTSVWVWRPRPRPRPTVLPQDRDHDRNSVSQDRHQDQDFIVFCSEVRLSVDKTCFRAFALLYLTVKT